jgi:hypothetical protein
MPDQLNDLAARGCNLSVDAKDQTAPFLESLVAAMANRKRHITIRGAAHFMPDVRQRMASTGGDFLTLEF